MRVLIMFIILIFIGCSNNHSIDKSSLEDSVINPSKSPSADTIVRHCECIDTLMVDSLIPRPPFDKVGKIVSYEFKDIEIKIGPTFKDIIADGKPSYKEIVKEIDITERKLQLEKILFNKVKRCNNGKISIADDCMYNPHHCIVFYNKDGLATDFIEICFQCDNKMTSKQKFIWIFL